jgi:hypothetical protein
MCILAESDMRYIPPVALTWDIVANLPPPVPRNISESKI